jgi:chemotaxis methyl-accepting protein methylase
MALSADVVSRVSAVLAHHAGLDLPAWVIEARAAARIARLGVAPHDYATLIGSGRGAAELAELVEAVRVGETRLFRHRSQIVALETAVAPALRGKRTVRVWSAGCAAGEEAYTLAIVLDRVLPGAELAIAATDMSADALAIARLASYPAGALDHVPDEYRDGFELAGDRIRVRRDLTARVRFERANLLDAAPGRDFDLVWCRNVLIYFTADARRRAVERIVGATASHGYVFVGYSESLRDVAGLDPVRAGDAVYYVRRPRRSDTAPELPVVTVTTAPRVAPIRPTPPPTRAVREDVLALHGQPVAEDVAAELATRLGRDDLAALAIDLDGAELLDDALAPVLRRVAAAARANGVAVRIVASRPGARRWLVRNQLDDLGGVT